MYARKHCQQAKRPKLATARPVSTFHHNPSAPGVPWSPDRHASSSSARPRSQPSPHVNPKITAKGKVRLAEEMRENRYRDSVCTMCSDMNSTSRHHHFSSTSIRRMFMTPGYDRNTTYMCPICKNLEPVVIPPTETRRIVLSSSTLYGVWDRPMPSNTVHFDIDAIVGGKVRDMTTALKKNYLHMPNRVEVIVVAGINNIGAGEKAENIVKEMEELKRVVG